MKRASGFPTAAFLTVNVAALLLLFVLLVRLLQRFNFSAPLAALTTLLALTANVAVLRTMHYGQINIVVLDLILATLLLYPRRPILSAVALALAMHLKVSPALLVLPFLLTRDWKWLASFALTTLIVVALTSLANDFSCSQEHCQVLLDLRRIRGGGEVGGH